MMKLVFRSLLASLALSISCLAHASAEIRSIQNNTDWNLAGYLSLAQNDPPKLLGLLEEQFRPEVRKKARTHPDMAFAWQDRVALVSALTELFNPEGKIHVSTDNLKKYRAQAQGLIARVALEDPALLVRDGAVEAIRRVNRMRPHDAKSWRKTLETAFMDRQNVMEGEGLFIRETILTAMREASLPLNTSMKKAAELDQNPKVRGLTKLWSTRAFDSL
ncbi:MAG: hypothetical protein ABIR96_12590 [Bdellovibrionota bacterium]